ncbi:LysR family transcriptional regulator [uncultured Ruegeria sp.]|uniref:LysR family transcriptional regulator n=1 Tax=uncultured Ruegeria sp. TaxID=259304 RepID=UPI002634E868|nr:LysR family transcriptional regulator [uncultured Ruegeria sp.]
MDQIVAMRAFVRVAQAQSFQEAAKLEGLTQGSVSKRVAALEDHLGVQLLRRNQRNVTLTTLGQAHYDDCIRLLGDLDAAEARIRTDARTPAGIVRVSMSPVLSRLIVAPLIVEFTQEYPKIEVVLFLTEAHVDIVGQGIDLALRARHLEDSALVARSLSSNPLMLAAAPSYLETAPKLESPEDLSKHRCLTFNRMKARQSWRFTQGRRVREVTIQGQLTADQGDTLVECAAAGAGVVLMPEWVVSGHLAAGRLVRLLPDWKPPSIPLHLVMASGSNVPLRVRLLSDFIRRSVRQRDLLPR